MSDKQTTKTEDTTTKSKISENAQRISTLVRAELESSEDKGLHKVKVKTDVFAASLPDDLTVELCEKVGDHLTDFAAGSVHAYGQFATEQAVAGKLNKKDEREFLDINIPMWGKNSLDISYTKEKTTVNTLKGDGSTTTKFGEVRASFDMQATRNRGQMKAVRSEINSFAEEAFDKLNK